MTERLKWLIYVTAHIPYIVSSTYTIMPRIASKHEWTYSNQYNIHLLQLVWLNLDYFLFRVFQGSNPCVDPDLLPAAVLGDLDSFLVTDSLSKHGYLFSQGQHKNFSPL